MFEIQVGNEQQKLTYENFALLVGNEEQEIHKEIVDSLIMFLNSIYDAFTQETVEKRAIELAQSLYVVALKENSNYPLPLAIVLSTYAVRFAFEHSKI